MTRCGYAAVWVLVGIASVGSADGWTSFQNGGKLALPEHEAPRIEWGIADGIQWSVPLAGYGQSSPVVYDTLIYVTSTSGENKERLHVQAFHRASGEELWRFDSINSTPEENNNYISRAAPSPICDGGGVIALFEGGNLIALDTHGELRWQRDLVADFGPITARHGLGSSIEQNASCVFAWIERQSEPYIVAISKSSGEIIWKADGLGSTSWSSPRLVPVGDGQHLVMSGIGHVVGIDPENGDRLWSLDDIAGNSTPTPVPIGNGRFLIGATAGRGTGDEGAAATSNGLVAIEPTDDGRFRAKFVWRAKRATSSFGSPLAYDGHAYFVNASGVVYCLDLATGDEKYAKRTQSSVWATPIGAANRIYLFGKNGTTTVLSSGARFETLATNPLWSGESQRDGSSESESAPAVSAGPVLYAVAASQGELIMRRGDWLYKVSH